MRKGNNNKMELSCRGKYW